MISPDRLDLASTLDFGEAIELHDALLAAVDAMAHFGSDVEKMTVISSLLVVAAREKATAFRAHERKES